MKICIISDHEWKSGVLNFRIEEDGKETIYGHNVFMFYTKKDAVSVLKRNIREKYGNDIKFKFEYCRNENAVKRYELQPAANQQKSFYRKAFIEIARNGDETLFSYETPIICRKKSGKLIRIWNDWSVTTGKHIFAFCGLRKKRFANCLASEILNIKK